MAASRVQLTVPTMFDDAEDGEGTAAQHVGYEAQAAAAIEQLEAQKGEAFSREDYEMCAVLRDAIKAIRGGGVAGAAAVAAAAAGVGAGDAAATAGAQIRGEQQQSEEQTVESLQDELCLGEGDDGGSKAAATLARLELDKADAFAREQREAEEEDEVVTLQWGEDVIENLNQVITAHERKQGEASQEMEAEAGADSCPEYEAEVARTTKALQVPVPGATDTKREAELHKDAGNICFKAKQ